MSEQLSSRQAEILELAALGHGRKAMARTLGISENTVKVHVAAIFARLQVRNMTEAVAVWMTARERERERERERDGLAQNGE
jgi:DNA-binding NarL/FixJ family response regulator